MNFQAVLLGHRKRCHCQRCSSDEDVLSRWHKEELAGSYTNLARHSLPLALAFSLLVVRQHWRLCPKCGGETVSTQAKEGRTSIQSAFRPWLVWQSPKTVPPSLLLYCRNSLTWEWISLINQAHLYTTGPNLNIKEGTWGYSLYIRGSGVPPPLGQTKITEVWDAASPQGKLSFPCCILRSQLFRDNPGLPSLYLD